MKLIGFVVNFLCIWLLGMNLASAEKFSLVELSNYFNKLDTFQANFRQFSDDGSEAKGVIQIKKPGRLRIDYKEPEDLLILGSGGQLAIFDPKGDVFGLLMEELIQAKKRLKLFISKLRRKDGEGNSIP